MKKLTTAILLVALVGTALFSLTACSSEEEEDLSSKVEEKVAAYRTDLEDSADTLTSTAAIKEYLSNWAKEKGITCTTDGHDNVIMSVKASEEYKEADPTVIVCSYDPKQFRTCIDPIALSLYAVKNNESTGRLTVIFTSEDGHDFSGIRSLNSKYFTDDSNVFCVNGGDKNMWSTSTAGRSSYDFSTEVSYTAPEGEKAYRIRIEGLPGGIPDSRISSYPNPIKEIGDLLAYFKTNSLIYELADIHGGESGNLYPKSASVTVVIDEDDIEKFQKRMETAIENYNDDNLEDYPEMTHTYEEVELPRRVMTQEHLNEFVSLLYTLIDGVYSRDDDDNQVSITSIGSIIKNENRYTISAVGNSLSEADLTEIDTAYKTICGLANVNYKKTDSQSGWTSDSDSDLAKQVAEAFNSYSGADMEYRDCVAATNATYIQEKNENCSIISVSVNENRLERYTGKFITFLLTQTHKNTEE